MTATSEAGPRPALPVASATACVLVPMFNEATVVGDVVTDLRRWFEHVVCIDDGSSDDSADVARHAGATVVRHSINLGQGAALQTGLDHVLRATDAAYVVTFDADGQHDPEDAVRLLSEARAHGVDVALGSRFLHGSARMPGRRRRMLQFATLFTRASTRLPVTDSHNGLRVLSRRAARELRIELRGMAHASELLHQIADRRLSFCEVPVAIRYTEYSMAKGQTGVNAVNILVDLFVQKVYANR